MDVYAGSLETMINWAGGVAKSKAIGAGIAVAINDTERKTRAVIGEIEDTAGTGLNGRSTIDVVGSVTARASVAGGTYVFIVAGAIANASADKGSSKNPLAGKKLPNGSIASGGSTGHYRYWHRGGSRRCSD